MTTIPKNFPPDAGDFISHKEAERMRDNYCNKKKKKHGADFIQAYFFGKDKLQALLDCQKDIVGLRIYYGDDSQHENKDLKKMVIYAVDKNGKNVLYNDPKEVNLQVNSLMATDAASTQSAGKALDNGLPCPIDCP
jgi:hypothetical protein